MDIGLIIILCLLGFTVSLEILVLVSFIYDIRHKKNYTCYISNAVRSPRRFLLLYEKMCNESKKVFIQESKNFTNANKSMDFKNEGEA